MRVSRMSDYISRQPVIDALDKRFDNIPMQLTEEILKLRKDLRELPPIQPEPQWIPVKREVPEMPGYYITSSEYGGVTVDFYYDHFWNARKNAYKVLAWMPLPKIYKPNNK